MVIAKAGPSLISPTLFEVTLAAQFGGELTSSEAISEVDAFVGSRGFSPADLVQMSPVVEHGGQYERRFTYIRGRLQSEIIDRKYDIVATSMEHGTVHTNRDAVLFLAKDRALPETLEEYFRVCVDLGAEDRQLQGISLLIKRVAAYQAARPGVVKVADVDDTPAGDGIIA